MNRDGLGAIIATQSKNFEYLTTGWRAGFDPIGYMMDEVPAAARPSIIIVPRDGEPVALVNKLFEHTKVTGWVSDVRTWKSLPFKSEYLRHVLTDMKLDKTKIGMEFGEELRLDIPIIELEKLKTEMPNAQFANSNIFWDLRTVKSEAEVVKIRTAAETTGKAFEKFLSIANSNMTIRDVIRILYNCFMEAGAQRPSFPPWLGSLSLDSPTFQRGKVYSLDTAAVFDDYTADVCRIAIVGRATSHQREMYEAVLKINDAVRKASRKGAKTRDLWDVCDAMIAELKVSRPIEPDRIGHGFGLVGNEPPTIGPNDPHTLVEGNVHCIEPGIGNADEWYYIEENVWVTGSGNQLLTSSISRELREIPA